MLECQIGMSNDLNGRTINATKWATVAELLANLVAPISSMILARLLDPSAYGILVIALMVISFAEIFTDAGFQKYLVQNKFDTTEDLFRSTTVAFWTNLVLSLIIWAIVILFATPIATIVGGVGYEKVIIVSCAAIPIAAFSSIQTAIFKRNLDFKSLFPIRMVGVAIPLVITVPLAFITRSYWSLIIGMLSKDVVTAVLLTIKSPWKPKFFYSIKLLKQMLSFTLWTMFEAVSIWLTSYIDIFIVTSFLSSHYLGLYRTSMTTVNQILALIVSSTTPVLFSSLSKLQDDLKGYKDFFYQFQKAVSIVLIPMGMFIYLFDDVVTNIFLGSQWLETSFFIGLFSLLLPYKILISDYSSEVCRSLGKPNISLYRQIFMMLVIFVCVFISVKDGYETLCKMRTLSMLGGILSGFVVLYCLARFNPIDLVKNIFPSSIASILMCFVIKALPAIQDKVWMIIIYIIIAACTYFSTLCLFTQERKILTNALSILKRR